ncbi:hypothetical protein K1T71_008670 [Dendrolimus kikuchii]|uniref:Uncharacterized protein n=1 Tax=Dendrolimus kikuchii TaxID=765133 RepID=A0ACC1CVA2_9NEOP|nr:hypothetical protein K1T71_008670 [Dendrolimus kikuchii]
MISPTEKIKVRNYICEQIRHVTCFECCNYYREPDTAACGHSLCHKCWVGRRKCPFCNSQVDCKTLKHNIPLQIRRENIHALKDAFTQHFNINLDEYLFNNNDLENKDNTENVADWLANSQNHFSAPLSMEPSCTQYESTHKVTTKVQIHETNNNTGDPVKKVYKAVSQHDWDVIDEMPDVNNDKKRENIIGPKDVEPFNLDDKEYSTENPRRSSRKRKGRNKIVANDESIDDIENINNCNLDTNSKVNKIKEYWNNVKRMKKDLNNPRKRSSKLDVSIENCKHVQEMSSKSNSADNVSLLQTIKGKEDKGEYNPTIEEVKKPCDENQEKNVKVIPVHNKTTNHNISGDAVVLHTESCYKNSSKEMDNNKIDIIIENSEVIQNKTKKLISDIGENTEKDTTNKKVQMRMPFIKKGALCPRQKVENNHKTNISQHISESQTINKDDDIKISIKMGNTITNIVIKKKESDVCMKMMTDQGVQTDLRFQEPSNTTNSAITLQNVSEKNIDLNLEKNQDNVIGIRSKNILNLSEIYSKPKSSSSSTKKHTASAETETVGEVITESVEKELANAVECCKDLEHEEVKDLNSEKHVLEEANVVEPVEISGHDADIFETESVKGAENLVLKHAPSEILMTTMGSKKCREEKYMTKRKERENDSEEQSSVNKKHKYVSEKETRNSQAKFEEINTIRDSDSINYDKLMSQVFANIDEDIECIRNSQNIEHNNKEIKISTNIINDQNPEKGIEKNTKLCQNFENSISFLDSEKHNWDDPKNVEDAVSVLCIDQFTPSTSKPNIMKSQKNNQKYAHEKMAIHDNDDSDRSVVEETPEKNISLPKIKQKTNTSIKQLIDSKTGSLTKNKTTDFSSSVKSVKLVTFEDSTIKNVQNTTIVDKTLQKNSLETPMSIDKFVGAITHRSTPVAKKSLNFDTENVDDPEQTLCSSIDKVAKNTQEKEIMLKAFECTPKVTESVSVKKKYCIAGSCLNGTELIKLKILCKENNWVYVDKYTKDLTHLVVSVDEENMSQRSVKYIRALAASKWIVSYAWVEKCLAEKRVVNEEFFEALDSTGEPGPMRSRTSKRKVFTGFKFFCMPPFSILDEDALKDMLESSGGQVVNSVQQVQVTENTNQPALLLAEPENTQEDRFVYLAMEHSVVPVNYEWVLNCLGSYSLQSIHDLLLCSSALLPPETSKWPSRLLAHDFSF